MVLIFGSRGILFAWYTIKNVLSVLVKSSGRCWAAVPIPVTRLVTVVGYWWQISTEYRIGP